MRRVAGGDASSFERLVKAHQQRLGRAAFAILGDRCAAQDAVQETMIRVWRNRAGYRRQSSLAVYLHKILRNICIDILRERSSKPAVAWDVEAVGEIPVAGGAAACELREALAWGLAQLPEEQRTIVALSEYEGFTYQEIAEIVGCPYGTVASRKYAAMDALRRSLRQWLNGEE
ncbi:RNA polymerase subunit sigma-24 [Capsulimonas corticalis]|uniref:RNA polymerase subunit sigma-24 n=2 Tax=Capsulimonas corticalis TaxID=2219043 RepID=A0A9N7L555_9BACT|nr:RNA polymerase subunit sigma-24 [Capsulimonas corticalis]